MKSLCQPWNVLSKSSTCLSDCIPTWFLKAVFQKVGPDILAIINCSLSTGFFPLKIPLFSPSKKALSRSLCFILDFYFRPISKLPFLSKILEFFFWFLLSTQHWDCSVQWPTWANAQQLKKTYEIIINIFISLTTCAVFRKALQIQKAKKDMFPEDTKSGKHGLVNGLALI